jgi:hypothetical protein
VHAGGLSMHSVAFGELLFYLLFYWAHVTIAWTWQHFSITIQWYSIENLYPSIVSLAASPCLVHLYLLTLLSCKILGWCRIHMPLMLLFCYYKAPSFHP